jgi:hypothetical protein
VNPRATSLRACVFSLGLIGCGARTALDVSIPLTDAAAPLTDAPPPPAEGAAGCGLSSATRLATVSIDTSDGFDLLAPITTLLVTGGRLFFGAWEEYGGANEGFIGSVPTTGGPLDYVTGPLSDPSDQQLYFNGSLVTDGTYLYYPHPTYPPGTIYYPYAVKRPIAGGGEVPIPDPFPFPSIESIATAGTGLVWIQFNTNTLDASLVYWNGSAPTLLAQTSDPLVEVLAIGDVAYVRAERSLLAFPLDGGGMQMLDTFQPGTGGLLGATANALFYSPDGASIVRLDVPGGTRTTLATDLSVDGGPQLRASSTAAYVDGTNLYFSVGSAVYRVPVAGGSTQLLTGIASADAITGDACNLYWTTDSVNDEAQWVMSVGKGTL